MTWSPVGAGLVGHGVHSSRRASDPRDGLHSAEREQLAMPARTGRQYLEGLRSQEREVWLGGERVRDVTTHPGLASGANAIASLYDMQCVPELRER